MICFWSNNNARLPPLARSDRFWWVGQAAKKENKHWRRRTDRGSVRFGGSADLHLDLHLLSDGWQEAAGLGRWPGERRLPGPQLELPLLLLLLWQSLKLRLWVLLTVSDQRMLPVSLSSTETGLKCVNISQSYSEKTDMSLKSDYFMIIFKGGGEEGVGADCCYCCLTISLNLVWHSI